jgi:hypothetical protein
MSADLAVAALLALIVFTLAAFGGHVSAERPGHKTTFWILGAIGVVLMILQTYRQQYTQTEFQRQITTKTERNLQLSRKITEQAGVALELQKQITAKTEQNLQLSQKLTQQGDNALQWITGGHSLCYINMLVESDGLQPVVLNKGQYPLYDLTVRLWDTKDYAGSMPSSDFRARAIRETVKLGTLPNNDFAELDSIALPDGIERTYSAEFAARNGSWSQIIVLRRTDTGWKVATVVQRSARVVKFAELNKPRPVLCYEAAPDFPEAVPGELRLWAGSAKRCSEP